MFVKLILTSIYGIVMGFCLIPAAKYVWQEVIR
jgi:hypothetical protein